MTVVSTRHGLSVYTGADDDTGPTPPVGSDHRHEGPRPKPGEILNLRWATGGQGPSDRSVRHHRVPSTVHLKAFGPDGTVTDENEPCRGGNTHHMQDTDVASCILGYLNFACFLPSDIPRH